MKNLFRLVNVIFLLGVLFGQVYVFAQPKLVFAQTIPDPIRVNNTSGTLPAYNAGVDKTIEEYLCTPTGNGTDLFRCIDRLYRFGITAGGLILVALLVIAGYLYITSGETGKTKAKSLIFSGLTGIGILLLSFVLLNFINPSLVTIKPIQPPIFQAADLPSCEDVGFEVDCKTAGGQVSYSGKSVAGSASEAQYKTLIAKYAQANGLKYCMLSALIQKESTFNRLIVSNPPPNQVDPNGTPPSYNVSFASSGHGIGLTQVYIYPKTTSRSGSEFGISGQLTVKDLIDPETSIKAGAYFFGKLVKERKNNLREAYDDYQAGRGGNSNPKTLDKYLDMYNSCEKRG